MMTTTTKKVMPTDSDSYQDKSQRRKFSNEAWLRTELEQAEKYFEDWHKSAREAEQACVPPKARSKKKKSHIYWSGSQLIIPALYSRTPKLVAKVKHNRSDPTALVASTIVERNTQHQIDDNRMFDTAMRSCVRDADRTSRGVTRVRYESRKRKIFMRVDLFPSGEGELVDINGQSPQGKVQQDDYGNYYFMMPIDDILGERVKFEHVRRKDFCHSRATTWEDVWWVRFDNYMYFDEVAYKFGTKVADSLQYVHSAEGREDIGESKGQNSEHCLARISELWNKSDQRVYWVSPDCGKGKFILEDSDDIYGLDDFFPCPRPLYFSLEPDKLIPIPEYEYVRDDIAELDECMTKRYSLMRMLGLRGVVDQSLHKQFKRLLDIPNGTLMPVNASLMAEKGGVKAAVEIFTLPEIVDQIMRLYESEKSIKETYYEKTGMSDILRGISDPRETAAAQQMKGQFATMRLGDKQSATQQHARDLACLAAELACEKFSDATLIAVAGLQGQEAEIAPQALQMLRNEGLRTISLDIETDSTIAITESLQKEAWTEYVATVGAQIPSFMQFMQMMPQSSGFFGQLLITGSRLFRFGRNVDTSLESFVNQMIQMANTPPQPPQPDPVEMQKVQNEAQKLAIEQQRTEQGWAKLQLEGQTSAQRAQEAQQKYELDTGKLMTETQLKAEEMRQEMDMKRMDQQHDYQMKTLDATTRFYQRPKRNVPLNRRENVQ